MSLLRNSLALSAVLLAAGCQVEKVQEGELPDIKVEGGRLPKYELKPSDEGIHLRLRMDTASVVVPKIEREPDPVRR